MSGEHVRGNMSRGGMSGSQQDLHISFLSHEQVRTVNSIMDGDARCRPANSKRHFDALYPGDGRVDCYKGL